MINCVSTFKSVDINDDVNDKYACAVVKDLNFQTSTFGIFNNIDDCDEYYAFLDGLNKLHKKVESGDLSDFTE